MYEYTKIENKLKELGLSTLCEKHQYAYRNGGKISAPGLIIGFFYWFSQGQNSLRNWAGQIGFYIGLPLSKQGLAQRLNQRTQDLCAALLEQALSVQVFRGLNQGIFSAFNAVYLEDSTCQSLPLSLREVFRGAYSTKLKERVATFRLQLTLELFNHSYRKISLSDFTQNDQGYASEILSLIQPSNLILRDLGYWSLAVFRQIEEKGAFFLSRLQPGVNLYDLDTNRQIHLAKRLKMRSKKNAALLDVSVCMGKKEQFTGRLIALPVAPQIANERRRKAKEAMKSDTRKKHSPDYLYLLGWNLFFTNVDAKTWTPNQVFEAYQVRWRIEICFKSWKSALRLKALFQHKQSLTSERVYITIYLALLWMVLFLNPWFLFFIRKAKEEANQYISLLLFSQFAASHFQLLVKAKNLMDWIPFVIKETAHEKRKRIAQIQTLFTFANFL